MPSPEQIARAQALLGNPNVPDALKAKVRARLGESDEAAPPPMDLGEGVTARLGEAVIGGGNPPDGPGGGSPYDRFKTKPAPVRTGNPKIEPPSSPSTSRADAVGGYLRSALHGVDRSMTGGLGTRLGEMVDPGTQARGEEAAQKYPVGEVLGMLGGALSPVGLAGRAGQLGNAAAQGAVKGAGALAKIGRGAMGGAVGAAAQETAEGALGDRPVDVGGATAVGGLLGGALGGIGAAAGAVKNAIRDPAEQMGRDIASAEKIGGGTAFWKGTKKGPAYEAAEDVARAETVAGAPISPSGVAARKAVPELGKAVQGDIDARLGAMGAENAAGGEELVSLQPVVAKAMKRLQGMTRDQKALPGMTTRDLAQTVRQSANVRVVDYADETLNHVDPENLIEAGAAKAMGLIRDQDVSGKFVVLEPRSVTPRELEDIRRSFDATGKITPSSKRVVGEAANAREMAGAAREARKQLGPEAVERASRHEQSLGEMENAINAARLPPGTRKVDLNDLATRKQLASGVGGYRARGNEASGADKVLDQLAGSGPLRGALDESAGVAAMERLRREGGASKLGSGPAYGLLDAQKLRADALARFLDDKVGATARPVGRGLIPFAAGASTGRKRQ